MADMCAQVTAEQCVKTLSAQCDVLANVAVICAHS